MLEKRDFDGVHPPEHFASYAPRSTRIEELRAQWKRFLADLPKNVPSARAGRE